MTSMLILQTTPQIRAEVVIALIVASTLMVIDLLVLRSSNTVHKSAPPMPRRFGRSSPHPRLRFAIQLASGHSRSLIYLEAIS